MSQAVTSDTNGGTASVSFDCLPGIPTDADTYYIHITNANGQSGPQTNYDLTIDKEPTQIQETISTPDVSGPDNGKVNQPLQFTASGAESNLGHSLEYQFWWDDDGVSEWGSATQTHAFSTTGAKSIKARARCETHTDKISGWSSAKQVNIEYCVLTMTVQPLGSGTISATPAGVVLTGIPENTYCGYGWNETVQLEAQASHDWHFDHWGGNLSGNTNPDSITMDGDQSVTAYFVENHIETISAPGTPTGETIPIVGRTYTYTTTGATSNLGHTVEYQFNWGDGTTSEWSTSKSASHIWLNTTQRLVTASARCQTHTDKTNISAGLTVTPVEETILTVESAYGCPSPEVGHTVYPKGKKVTAGIDSPVSGDAGVRYVCTGWIGAGSVPPSGTITSVTFTINEESSIAWHWKTQYQVNIHVSEGGTVFPESGGWYDAGTEVMLIATPDECFTFEGWGGDLTGNETTKNLVMNGPKSISAAFTHMKGDTNGDGNVDLADVILALQVISGMNSTGVRSDYASSGADVNGDGKIGIEEAIYILQKVSGVREQ